MSYIGTNKIGKIYLGSTEIAKAYLGGTLVFHKGTPGTTEERTFIPSSYDSTNSQYYSIASGQPITNGYADTESTTYAQINLTRGASAETHFYYKFDFSQIPANATINSITVKSKAVISTAQTNRIASRGQDVCRGTTAVGGNTTLNTTTTVRTMDAGSGWTRENLDNLAVHVFATRASSGTSTNYYISFYGAEVTVNYTY